MAKSRPRSAGKSSARKLPATKATTTKTTRSKAATKQAAATRAPRKKTGATKAGPATRTGLHPAKPTKATPPTARDGKANGPAVKTPRSVKTTPIVAGVAPATPPSSAANTNHISVAKGGLTVTAYRGDGSVLLGFDLDQHLTDNFAGFAVKLTAPGSPPAYLMNRLSFDKPLAHDSTPQQRQAAWTPSNVAPFQKYRWQHFPKDVVPGAFQYEVTAMYFAKGGGTTLEEGPKVDLAVNLVPSDFGLLDIGFTRSFVSSQAYATEFGNKDLRPTPKTLDYDTKGYEQQYAFLGYHARKLVFDFLNECLNDNSITVDAFVYDIDEPDIVRALQKLGPRLRVIADNASLHLGKALEVEVHKRLVASAGADHVKQGKFNRFSHDKVLIQKKNGIPTKVLTGSANFSVRGLYVQANNVLVFTDPDTAGLYGKAFNEAWKDTPDDGSSKGMAKAFAASPMAQQWFSEIQKAGLPPFEVAFSPHVDSNLSLKKVADAINNAQSSVMFAVMELGGGGPVLQRLNAIASDPKIFSYGITQNMTKAPPGEETTAGVTVHGPSRAGGVLVPFAFLSKNVPPPFNAEVDGGPGQVIHNKFVVVDFNGKNPAVFTGSSNLAAGGEQSNGDNLIAIYDRSIATLYGVEAISLVDHFDFRAALKGATAQPLRLKTNDEKWYARYYDPNDLHCRERQLFVM
jgi:phosphatidylserine/phosphatidylglycerophosphate/cardiolipin synthase-like enzyme